MCTGNICRSPVAHALLRHRLAAAGVEAEVASAGLLSAGNPASSYGVELLRELDIPLDDHRSCTLTSEMLRDSDLVLGMAREHVREAVVLAPDAWSRTFTLKELVRRGQAVGARRPNEPLTDWLAQVHAGRSTHDLLGTSPDDDVDDPIGRPRAAYETMVSELDRLVDQLISLVWGPMAMAGSGAVPPPPSAELRPEAL